MLRLTEIMKETCVRKGPVLLLRSDAVRFKGARPSYRTVVFAAGRGDDDAMRALASTTRPVKSCMLGLRRV